jgi:8-oxo-dGTP diphosphatase
VQEQYLEQLYTLSVPEGHTGWTVVVGYIALLCTEGPPAEPAATRWCSLASLDALDHVDHNVAEYAVVRLRAKLGYTTIAFHLLPASFTLTELQTAYETILDQELDKRNFRRRMIASGLLQETKEKRRDGSHRPAALYRFRAEHDPGAYLTPAWGAPSFEGLHDSGGRQA